VGQNSPKSLKTCYPLKPLHAKFHRDRWNLLGKKRYNFFTPWPKVSGLGGVVYEPSSSYLQNFVPFRRPFSKISAAKLHQNLLPACMTHKTYSKRYLSALYAATIIFTTHWRRVIASTGPMLLCPHHILQTAFKVVTAESVPSFVP